MQHATFLGILANLSRKPVEILWYKIPEETYNLLARTDMLFVGSRSAPPYLSSGHRHLRLPDPEHEQAAIEL